MAEEAPEISLSVDVKSRHVTNGLQGLHQDMEKPLQNRIAGAIANDLVFKYIEALQENGSTVTRTGLQSIESDKIGTGQYGVYMKAYLDQVDKGTTAEERKPVEMNERLVEAANQYGLAPGHLQGILRTLGTEEKPFKDRSRDKTRENAAELAAEKIGEAIKDSFREGSMSDVVE